MVKKKKRIPDTDLTSVTKINHKWITPKCKHKAETGMSFRRKSDIRFGDDFLAMKPKSIIYEKFDI